MIAVITIALWAHLFCGKWSEPGGVFGWLKGWAHKSLPEWLFIPFIGCAMCHAVWVALAWEGAGAVAEGGLTVGHFLGVFSASYLADLLNDFEALRDKWKNS